MHRHCDEGEIIKRAVKAPKVMLTPRLDRTLTTNYVRRYKRFRGNYVIEIAARFMLNLSIIMT